MKSVGQKSYIQRFECFISLHLTGGSLNLMELNSLLPWVDKREKSTVVLALYILNRLENTLLIRGIPGMYRKRISIAHDYVGFHVKLFVWLPKCFMV